MANPVSILFEYSTINGIPPPSFDLISTTGESHLPTFQFKAKLGELETYAQGASKQKAKHAAAKALFDLLQESGQMKKTSDHVNELNLPNNPLGQLDNMVVKRNIVPQTVNAIGCLQELCISMKWSSPVYEDLAADGPPHSRTFIVACRVSKLEFKGSGATKKNAKHAAALKMWEHLKEMKTLNNTQLNTCFGYVDTNAKMIMDSPKMPIQSGVFGESQDETDCPIKMEIDADLESAVDSLDELAAKNEIDISYIDIEKRSYKSYYQCLVKIHTEPVAICFGSGVTPQRAKQFAALDALKYLDLIEDLSLPNLQFLTK